MVAVRHLERFPDDVVLGRVPHLTLVGGRRCTARRGAAVYRRRRAAAATVVVVLALTASRLTATSSEIAAPVETRSLHVVQPGESYWSIASALDSDGDITGAVDALADANGGRPLQVGDRLEVPG